MRHTCIVFAFLFLFCLSVTAQDRLTVENAEKDRDVAKGLAIGKEFTGRLPNGYRGVVSNSQREEIYKIQQEYFDVIELLKVRIELLEAERSQKIDGLLTGDQRMRIKTILGNLESERSVRQAARTPGRTSRTTPVRSAPVGNAPATESPVEE